MSLLGVLNVLLLRPCKTLATSFVFSPLHPPFFARSTSTGVGPSASLSILHRCWSVRASLCKPRLKTGRPGDFQLSGDTPTMLCRQRLRQCRRLQTLCRLVSKDAPDHVQIACTWRAILTAPGFKPNFPAWLLAQVFCPIAMPEHAHLELMRNLVHQHLVTCQIRFDRHDGSVLPRLLPLLSARKVDVLPLRLSGTPHKLM